MTQDPISISTTARVDDVADEWAALCAAVGGPPWLRPEWFRLWQPSFGRGGLEIVTARSTTSLTGVWVFERRGRELRSAANSETPEHGPVAADEASLAALVDAVIDRRPPRINLFPFVNDSPAAVAVRSAASDAGYLLLDHDLGGAPFVTMNTWDAYRERLDSKMLREIRRRRRRLEEQGPLELVIHTELDAEELDSCFGLELEGWKGRAGTAMASRPETRSFYSSLAQAASEAGELILAVLKSNGRAIAFDLSIERDGVHYLLKTAFDEHLAKLGPGSLLRYEMLQRAFSVGLSRYEFLGRYEPWKKSWAFEARSLVHLRAFRSNLEGRAFGWLRSTKRSMSRSR